MSQAVTCSKRVTAGLRAEEATEHPADLVGAEGDAGAVGLFLQPGCQSLRGPVELLVEAVDARQFQGRQAGRERDRIAGQGAGLVDRAQRGDLLHDVAATAEGADRQAAADDLAQRGEIGCDAIVLLGAARGRRGNRSSPRRR